MPRSTPHARARGGLRQAVLSLKMVYDCALRHREEFQWFACRHCNLFVLKNPSFPRPRGAPAPGGVRKPYTTRPSPARVGPSSETKSRTSGYPHTRARVGPLLSLKMVYDCALHHREEFQWFVIRYWSLFELKIILPAPAWGRGLIYLISSLDNVLPASVGGPCFR
jgi:hypothetical protein